MDVNQSLHEFLAAFFLFFCVSWKTIGQRGTGAHNSGFCDIENKRKRGSDKNNNNEHPLLQTPPFPYGSLKTKVLKVPKTDLLANANWPVRRSAGGHRSNRTIMAMLVDRSGSMESMGSNVADGCNVWLTTRY